MDLPREKEKCPIASSTEERSSPTPPPDPTTGRHVGGEERTNAFRSAQYLLYLAWHPRLADQRTFQGEGLASANQGQERPKRDAGSDEEPGSAKPPVMHQDHGTNHRLESGLDSQLGVGGPHPKTRVGVGGKNLKVQA
ncbi:unnamed protein product [Sphagnum jensenii]|uniref:Uncharacterized protein n=1 Tax=Sphagnum jensenii TaxID=128206 RepID=A0ABP0WTT8_9BRYO